MHGDRCTEVTLMTYIGKPRVAWHSDASLLSSGEAGVRADAKS